MSDKLTLSAFPNEVIVFLYKLWTLMRIPAFLAQIKSLTKWVALECHRVIQNRNKSVGPTPS